MVLVSARLCGCHVVRVVDVSVLLRHDAVHVGGVRPRVLLPVCRVAILVSVQRGAACARGSGPVGRRQHPVATLRRGSDVWRRWQGREVVVALVDLLRIHVPLVDRDGFSRGLHLVSTGVVHRGGRRVVECLGELDLRAKGSTVLHDGRRRTVGEEGRSTCGNELRGEGGRGIADGELQGAGIMNA